MSHKHVCARSKIKFSRREDYQRLVAWAQTAVLCWPVVRKPPTFMLNTLFSIYLPATVAKWKRFCAAATKAFQMKAQTPVCQNFGAAVVEINPQPYTIACLIAQV